jgi:hypothetical protein
MRTEKDIGSENPETTTVSGFFVLFFKVEFKRYHFPKTTFGEDLNEIQQISRADFAIFSESLPFSFIFYSLFYRLL